MKRLTVIAGLAIGMAALAVWASGLVVGQPNPSDPPTGPAPKPTLQFEQGQAPAEPSPAPTPAEPAALDPKLPPPLVIPAPMPSGPFMPVSAPGSVAPEAPQSPADPGVPGVPANPSGVPNDDNPTGRQEPALSIEWVGPPTIKLGQPAVFQIVVKNVSTCPVFQAVVRSHVPPGVTIKGTEPKAVTEGDTLVWEVGSLVPQQERRLDVQMVPDKKGRCACQATVTFTGSSTVLAQVQEPKLILKAVAPEKPLLGDAATIMLTVSNPGDGTADHVRVKVQLSEGLECVHGHDAEFDLGNLGPNESRSVQVACATKDGGEQKCEATASAEGNLVSADAAVFTVLQPKLELTVSGPRVRYLDRQGLYTFKVVNPGSAPANNVMITEQIPQGFKFVEASAGGRHDFASRTVAWFVGDLLPHQSREVSLQLLAVNIGEFKHVAMARAARGLQTDAETETRVEGLSAMLVELVDLDDPVEVGANCRYELRVTNTGSKTETNIQVVCTLPDKMEFWGAQGAGNCHHRVEGKEVIFEALPKLAPRADAVFRVSTRPLAPGDVRFRARIKADSLTEPVNKEESTKVFGDEASGSVGVAPVVPVSTGPVAPPAPPILGPVAPPPAPSLPLPGGQQ
jgi:uncharacterized repeat protein (TIGR01451 family)